MIRRIGDGALKIDAIAFDDAKSRFFPTEQKIIAACFQTSRNILDLNFSELRKSGIVVRDTVFDIADDYDLNAFAFTDRKHDAILINGGLAVTLFVLFYRLLSERTVFPWVGNPASERTSMKPFKDLPDSLTDPAEILRISVGDPFQLMETLRIQQPELAEHFTPQRLFRRPRYSIDLLSVVPQDQVRRAFAVRLWRWAMSYVLLHELAHLLCGHADYLYGGGRFQVHGEFARRNDLRIARSQEFQADMYAAMATLLPLLTTPAAKDDLLLVDDVSKRLYAWGFATAVVFSVFRMMDVEDLERVSTHAHPLIRLHVAALGVGGRATIMGIDRGSGDTSPLRAWADLDAVLPNLLPSRYARFLTDDPPERRIPLDAVMGSYPDHDKWRQFDRLAAVGDAVPLAIVIP